MVVVCVCAANVCRSPVAERVLQAWFDESTSGRIEVSSAGLWAVPGRAMAEQSAELVARYGGDPRGFRARQLVPEMLRDADVVLTMSRQFSVQVLDLEPRLLHRTFTVREFARYAAQHPEELDDRDPVSRMSLLVSGAARSRPQIRAARPEDDDVFDPYGLGPAEYRAMELQLIPALRLISGVPDRSEVHA